MASPALCFVLPSCSSLFSFSAPPSAASAGRTWPRPLLPSSSSSSSSSSFCNKVLAISTAIVDHDHLVIPSKDNIVAANMSSSFMSPHSAAAAAAGGKLEEMFISLEGWAEENIVKPYLKPAERSWQPQDMLPDPSSEEESFFQGVAEMRRMAADIPDEILVCLVGNMVTEEALPTYQSFLTTFNGIGGSGDRNSSWMRWIRRWTAEENRHGDLLNRYLYLTGRVDMRQIEKTIHYLIGSGMEVQTENSPHNGFIYTSFQERATFISHGNTARMAKRHGDSTLAKICGTIAADERRHETAYTKVVEKLFEIDPDATMLSLAGMMKKRIAMPAHLMRDSGDEDDDDDGGELFARYAAVAQRVGMYTARDYGDNVEFFVGRWKVEEIAEGLSGEGRRAQDFVCGLPARIRRMEERALNRSKSALSLTSGRNNKNNNNNLAAFSWIFNRKVASMTYDRVAK